MLTNWLECLLLHAGVVNLGLVSSLKSHFKTTLIIRPPHYKGPGIKGPLEYKDLFDRKPRSL